MLLSALQRFCFNTQPPEGGWWWRRIWQCRILRFQHTAARRRLGDDKKGDKKKGGFQHTAARRRLVTQSAAPNHNRSFNTQPPEGGWLDCCAVDALGQSVSTHSRPKAAGRNCLMISACGMVSTHSRPKAAGWANSRAGWWTRFQHTAARRRLGCHQPCHAVGRYRFNTQPPEGGWFLCCLLRWAQYRFQHTAARRRLGCFVVFNNVLGWFQHTAARRRLG